jgi:hypothetical protein
MNRTQHLRLIGVFSFVLGLAMVTSAGADTIPVASSAQRVASLSWLPPTANDDGSVIDLAGYRIYGGTDPERLALITQLDHPGTTAYVVESLEQGTHYFAVSSLATGGAEGALSAVMAVTIL